MGKVLFALLAKKIDDKKFEKVLAKFIEIGEKINDVDGGKHTVLDTAIFTFQTSRAEILKKYGAKTSAELGCVPDVSDHIIPGAGASALGSGYSSEMAAVEWSDFNADGILYQVDSFLRAPEKRSSLNDKLTGHISCVGLLTASGMGIGSSFLISTQLVMVARHCLNGASLDELTIRFDSLHQEIEVSGVVEDGADVGLDYAILKLKSPVEGDILIPSLSENKNPTQFIFIGYDSDEELCFTNYVPSSPEYALVGLTKKHFRKQDLVSQGLLILMRVVVFMHCI